MARSRPVGPAARFFEDFAVGERIVTQGRTLTEADGVMWAMFTGDMNPMHVDDVYAAEHGLFGGRFPPGLMAVSIASGLKERLGLFAGTGLAMVEQTIRYHRPAVAGDTIHVELTVESVEPAPDRARGTVRFRYQIVDQQERTVATGHWVMVVAARSTTTGHPGPLPAGEE